MSFSFQNKNALCVNWERTSFSKAFELIRQTRKLKSSEIEEIGSFPVIDQGQGLIAGFTNDAEGVIKGREGLIIFGDHTRELKFVDFDFVPGADGIKILKPVKALDLRFAFYFLQSQHLPNEGYSRHFKYLKALEVPLPPLEEQKRIAEILDEVDQVRKKTQALIDKYDELAESLFLDMFGDPVTNPKGWEVKPLGSIVKLENGDRGKGYPKPTDISDDGIPWLNAGDLNGGYATLTEAKRISIEAYHRMSRGKFNDGDILFCLRGSVGKHGLVSDFSGAIASSLVILRKSEVVNSSFLSFWLSSRKAKIEIDKRQNGSSQPNLGANDLKEFELFLPPRELQIEFKSQLEILETSKRLISLHAKQNLFKALLQKAFKGELN